MLVVLVLWWVVLLCKFVWFNNWFGMSVLSWCLVICVGGDCGFVCDALPVICCRGLSFVIGFCCDVIAGWFLVCVIWIWFLLF